MLCDEIKRIVIFIRVFGKAAVIASMGRIQWLLRLQRVVRRFGWAALKRSYRAIIGGLGVLVLLGNKSSKY